jgi:putative nucleotidyltransferase with HDIG domain
MRKSRDDKACRSYTALVIITGISLWSVAAALLSFKYALSDQLFVLALVPLTIVTGMFPNTFPLPSVLKSPHEKITFTLSDAIVLLVACWYGLSASIFIAGIEGFTSSRRTVSRLSSNLYSFGMMSLATAAAGATLSAIMSAGAGIASPGHNAFPLVAVALLAASITHIVANAVLFSTLFALRNHHPMWKSLKANLLWAIPMALPTSAAASLMYIVLQYNVLMMILIAAPLLFAIFLGHRQYRNSIQERISSLEKAHHEMVEALAVAINAKDEVTHEHVLRVQIYAAGVARLLGCTELEIEALKAGALLHDVGKIAVPDYVLQKPGKLTAAEFEKMKLHTIVGAQILSRVEFPYPVVPVVRHHHERWDGKGYPDGLAGEDIPLTARVLSVVDCFDAVREDRQYRRGMTREEAIEFLMSNSGILYDPQVVGTFITHLPEFEAEIRAHRGAPMPTFGIEPIEQLSEAARAVAPAAGLAESPADKAEAQQKEFTVDELRALYALAQSLHSARGREEMIAAFIEKLNAIAPHDACSITLSEPESGDYEITHATGEHAGLLLGRKVMPGEGVIGWVIANRHSFCNTDPRLDLPPALAEKFAAYRTLAVFPVLKDKELFGAIAVYSTTLGEYDANQQRLLSEAAGLLALAFSGLSETVRTEVKQQEMSETASTPNATLKNSPISLAPNTQVIERLH